MFSWLIVRERDGVLKEEWWEGLDYELMQGRR
jgi:hypothetical protein